MLLQSSQLVLDTVHQLLVTTLKQLETELFMNIEVALRFFYMMGEVLPDKVIIIFLCCCSHGLLFPGLSFLWSGIIQFTMVSYDECSE